VPEGRERTYWFLDATHNAASAIHCLFIAVLNPGNQGVTVWSSQVFGVPVPPNTAFPLFTPFTLGAGWFIRASSPTLGAATMILQGAYTELERE